MASIRVLLAEDHRIVREGTRQLLEQEGGLVIVGEAEDGQQAVDMTAELLPDVVVMDGRMPVLNGLEATRAIKDRHPGVRVLILSAYESDQYVFPALEAGADGYLLKTSSGQELARAIRRVYRGQSVLDPQITGRVVEQVTARRPPRADATMVEALSERELEVLQVVAAGKSNKEIADRLSISVYTVQVHLRNIYGKLGVASRTEAVTVALRRGWITLDLQQ
ncbi:MAG: response regulator transcription factor [Chloroflexi bacterium]|nr:response regulator transcription factor [Chloroflexota bacterium]